MIEVRFGAFKRTTVPRGDSEKPNSATSAVQWAREPSISFLFSADVTRAKLEAAGFRVVAWQDTTAEALESAARRARNAATAPPPLGTHLILGGDWQAMFRNSARNLEERRTELFNAILERVA